MINAYQTHKSTSELNHQLLVGLLKHLRLSQDTTQPKDTRIVSLDNLVEVLQYVVGNINEACGPDEVALYEAFFMKLLARVVQARVAIHSSPMTFNDEIGFIKIMLNINYGES